MPFTHHSHSSTYCQHAASPLPSILARAQSLHFHTLALTEHMPRTLPADLYPEELASATTPFSLSSTFHAFHEAAHALRASLISTPPNPSGSPPLNLLIGFETEIIRAESYTHIASLLSRYKFDFIIGSVHFVHEVPIDFDRPLWEKAMALSSPPTEAGLVAAYLRDVLQMVQKLQPAVVGHLDVIRLHASEKTQLLQEYGPEVWELVLQVLAAVKEYDGLLELNSAGVRKGLGSPYPGRDIATEWVRMGGRFCLSDDAHSVEQVGQGYGRVLEYIKELGVGEVWYLSRLNGGEVAVNCLGICKVNRVGVEELEGMQFWGVSGEGRGDGEDGMVVGEEGTVFGEEES